MKTKDEATGDENLGKRKTSERAAVRAKGGGT